MNLSITKEEMWLKLILEGTSHKQRQETARYNGFSESPPLHCNKQPTA